MCLVECAFQAEKSLQPQSIAAEPEKALIAVKWILLILDTKPTGKKMRAEARIFKTLITPQPLRIEQPYLVSAAGA